MEVSECPTCGNKLPLNQKGCPNCSAALQRHHKEPAGPLTLVIVVLACIFTLLFFALLFEDFSSSPVPVPVYAVAAKDIHSEFKADDVAAYAKYHGKVVQVSGKYVSSEILFEHPTIFLDRAVYCQFPIGKASEVAKLNKGSNLILYGVVDQLGKSITRSGVHLDECSIAQ